MLKADVKKIIKKQININILILLSIYYKQIWIKNFEKINNNKKNVN
jgi:hypothetical protein